ncbi:hypothetical protein M3Y97_00990300 [Aphelenchoides bicaudatus]|nr:hypothetical protein M3Y97_00990300 [Aphelenchoides bicaudatus]
MGVEYLRSIHGVLSALLVLLTSFAIFVGHVVWRQGDVYFLFILYSWPLVTMTLAFLTIVWFTSMIIMLAQTLGKDLLEQLGKLKVLIIHAICALLICASAIAESFYVSHSAADFYYFPRLIMVMISCWLMLLCLLGQIAYVAFQ